MSRPADIRLAAIEDERKALAAKQEKGELLILLGKFPQDKASRGTPLSGTAGETKALSLNELGAA